MRKKNDVHVYHHFNDAQPLRVVVTEGIVIAQLRKEIAELLTGEKLPPAVQKKINAVFDKVGSNTAVVQKAVDTNQGT